MYKARQFRCLVRERSVLDSEYSICNQYFAFRTVFYTRGSSYCCCRCAYDHEYLTYISDNGDIDLEKFEKLAKAVESGYCEHAFKVENKDYLEKTKVHFIHVAAALGLEDIVESIVRNLNDRSRTSYKRTLAKMDRSIQSGLFHLTPCDIGVLKHNGNILHLVDKLDFHKKVLRATESGNHSLHIEETSGVELFFQENDIETLWTLLDVVKAEGIVYYELLFKFSLNDKLKEILGTIVEGAVKFNDNPFLDSPDPYYIDSRSARDVTSIGELAVIYNQSDLFVKSVYAFSETFRRSPGIQYTALEIHNTLVQVCVAFQRLEFQQYIDLHPVRSGSTFTADVFIVIKNKKIKMSDTSKLECLLRLMANYKLSRDRVKTAMEQIPDLPNTINAQNKDGLTLLQSYICGTSTVDMSVVRTLIDLGANIDIPLARTPHTYSSLSMKNSDGQSLLAYILNNRLKYKTAFEEVVELFLYENISLAKNSSTVSIAVKVYKKEQEPDHMLRYGQMRHIAAARYEYDFYSSDEDMPQTYHSIQSGTYIMDATLRENIFNSVIPLLIEAGFKYDLSDIEDTIDLFKDLTSTNKSLSSSEESIENSLVSMPHVKRKLCNPEDHAIVYLQRCLSEPRSLMLRCRDVLRNHFPRRQIHRYVSVMDIPNRIRDFLLLKPILQRLPLDIKSESYNRYDKIRKPVSAKGHGLPRKPLSDNHHESASKALPENLHESMRKSSNNQNELRRTSSSINHYRSNIVKNKRSRTKNQIV